ncbi:hypothetical protein DM02DRAFT_697262 [Periconia macrospinosa]|uniref:Uncharacterized protein n=1 Tax=Periconia macrospinosa TaxID=97972 RepID=A0A2V1E2T4_9PLEO|nr:hypothetical protein DM02DRAFT_697262 [Periconia macrospinosa]
MSPKTQDPVDHPTPSRIPRPSPKALPVPVVLPRPQRSPDNLSWKRDLYANILPEAINDTDSKKDAYIASLEQVSKSHQAVISKGVRDILDLKNREKHLMEEVQQLKEQLEKSKEAKKTDTFLDSMVNRQRDTERELKALKERETKYQQRIKQLENEKRQIKQDKENSEAQLSSRVKELESQLASETRSSTLKMHSTTNGSESATPLRRTNAVARRIEKFENHVKENPKSNSDLLLRARCRQFEHELKVKTERETQLLERIAELENEGKRVKTREANFLTRIQELESAVLKTNREFSIAKKLAEDHKKCKKAPPCAAAVPIVIHITANINTHDPNSRGLFRRLHSTLSASSNRSEWRGELGKLEFQGPQDAIAEIMKEIQDHDEMVVKMRATHKELQSRWNLAWDELQKLKAEKMKIKEENNALRTQLDINAAVMEGLSRRRE